jgi:hypothetical protein
MADAFAKINPTDPLILAKQAARRKRNWLLFCWRGSRSCVLVVLIICCVWRANRWSIRELFDFHKFNSQGSHFFNICLERALYDGGITGLASPGWGNSWFHTWALWRVSRGGNRRNSVGGGGWSSTLYISCTLQLYLLTRTG